MIPQTSESTWNNANHGRLRVRGARKNDPQRIVSVRSSPLEQIMKSVLEVSTYF